LKLIIQIPCFNEQDVVLITLSDLPKEIKGIDVIEILIIDDGSTDNTVQIAKEFGVNHIVSIPENRGLANAYIKGLDACLKAGADIIVNTDADNQYRADDIKRLVTPIIENKVDIVIGTRPISQTEHFSYLKKKLQKIGSWVVRYASGTSVEDAPSGFRAISRDAAIRLYVFNKYTYTLETIIQAGQSGMSILSVPIRTNDDLRPSKLAKSMRSYVQRSIGTILKIFMIYRPVKSFFILGMVPFLIGLALSLRWIVLFYLEDGGRSHLPSLILSAILIIIGFQTLLFGLFAELISANRKILEENRARLRTLELRGVDR
jgi:glycosyltransferase involved in cell wall biosynthesis